MIREEPFRSLRQECTVSETLRIVDDFLIVVHPAEHVVEVVYPAHPTPDMFDAYQKRLQRVVLELNSPRWMCLVDQRAMAVAPEALTDRIALFNAWALDHGMVRSARIIQPRLMAKLQANHILQHGGVRVAALYHTREEAWAWLTTEQVGNTKARG